jgi:hypothetical protein
LELETAKSRLQRLPSQLLTPDYNLLGSILDSDACTLLQTAQRYNMSDLRQLELLSLQNAVAKDLANHTGLAGE